MGLNLDILEFIKHPELINLLTKKQRKIYIKYCIDLCKITNNYINYNSSNLYIPEGYLLLEKYMYYLDNIQELQIYLKEDLISSIKCLMGYKKEIQKRYKKFLLGIEKIKENINNTDFVYIPKKYIDKLLINGYREDITEKYPNLNYIYQNVINQIPTKKDWINNNYNKNIDSLYYIEGIEQFNPRNNPPNKEQLKWLKEKYKENNIYNEYKYELIISWYNGLFPYRIDNLLSFIDIKNYSFFIYPF